jgi:hypothetical protein
LAWQTEFIGRFVFAACESTRDVEKFVTVRPDSALIAIEPDEFGLGGKLLAQCSGLPSTDTLTQVLRDTMARASSRSKSFHNHVREGHQLGLVWETKIPVTDPQEQAARQRGRLAPKK